MRLNRIHLRNYRGVEDREITFGPGVTIIEGENEAGKSSLMEAVRYLRLYQHTSKRQEIKDVQPVGKDVGPEVTLEATVGGNEVRYTKRWLRLPVAELQVRGVNREDHAGLKAHTRFNELLERSLDLDLMDALEVVQGQSLAQPKLGQIRTLRSALAVAKTQPTDASDGSTERGSGETGSGDELMSKVQAEYETYYTKRGQVRGRLKEALAALDQAGSNLTALEEKREEAEELGEHFDAVRARSAEVAGELKAAREAETVAATRQEEVEQAQRARSEAEANVDALRGEVELADSRLERQLDALARQAEAAEALAASRNALRKAEEDKTPIDQALADAKEQAKAARTAQEAALETLTQAEETEAALEQAEELNRLETLSGRIKKTQAEKETAGKLRRRYLVDDTALAELRTLEQKVLQTQSALTAASATVLVERLNSSTAVKVDGVVLSSQTEPYEQTVSHPLAVEVPGEVRVTVSPAQTSGSYEQQLLDAQAKLSEALNALKATTVEDAAKQNAKRQKAQMDEDTAAERLADLTAHQTLAEVEARIEELTSKLNRSDNTQAQQASGELKVAVPDTGAAGSLDAARSATVTARQQEQETRNLRAETSQALQAAQFAADSAAAEISRAQTALAEAEEKKTAAESALRDVNDVETLRKNLARTQIRLEDGQNRLAETTKTLETLGVERTALELKETQAQVALLESRAQTLASEETKTKAVLDRLVEEGLHTRVGDAESEYQNLEAEVDGLTRKAAAARTLWQVLTKHHAAAQEKYAGPLQAALRDLGIPVFGPGFDVEVGSDLQIVSRSDGATHVPFESLSAGAQEQLAVLGRLAAATLIDEKGAPLILDDTLGFSDPQRLESLGQVFTDMKGKAQVVILTCQPSRYQTVQDATIVKL